MNNIFIITDKDVFPNSDLEKSDSYEVRPTVKIIVSNNEEKIAFVTSERHGLFLLPGGGAESGDLRKEAERECEKEINWNIEIKEVVATSVEFRNRKAKKYETTCFSAVTVSESPMDTRTESERENDLQVNWLTKEETIDVINSQYEKVKKGEVDFYNLAFNIVRDKYFIEEYYKIQKF